MDVTMVERHAKDIRSLLEEVDFMERKVFLRSFIKRIVVNKKQVTVHYNLQLPQDRNSKAETAVLPIDTRDGYF